jgi:hypothetical protein
MTTLPIVEHLDVVKDGIGQFEARLPRLAVEELVLHARPERLHHGVVERISDRSERRHEASTTNSLGEGPRRKLRSVVRVND